MAVNVLTEASPVVIDNGSIDQTVDLVTRMRSGHVPVSVIGCARSGKGAAVRRGIHASRARFVGYMDADLATPIVVTRLVPHKQLHLLVEAVPDVLVRWPDLRVEIAGWGTAHETLLAQVRRPGLEAVVRLHGRVSEQAKSDLFSRAWLTVAPSLVEGWGLTVLEANALGTPAVAYDVPSLRDSVRDTVTGWLVPPGQGLGKPLINALNELTNPDRRQLIADQCRRWARRFSWDASVERLARVLLSEVARKDQGCPLRRDGVDLTTVASWPPGQVDGDVERRLQKALRVTDLISKGPDGLRVLLVGCDEVGAARALERVPVQPSRLRLATTTQVLCGIGEDHLP